MSALLGGCGETETQRTLPPVQVAMNREVAPFYDDGELTYYEVRLGVLLPILAPDDQEMAALENQTAEPYERMPWLTLEDSRLQLGWTLSNLDPEPHNVRLLIDPWNEFAKYYPGLQVVDSETGESVPNLSGIEYLFRLEGSGQGASSRLIGTFTFDDMDELARDFATVMNLIANPPPALGGGDEETDPALVYVNHLYHFQNHSDRDPLVKGRVPAIIPALTGFDVGLRTEEPATIAVEVVAELVDRGGEKVQLEETQGPLLEEPEEVITLGSAAPAAAAPAP